MKLIDGTIYEIPMDDEEVKQHFDNPHNYTQAIIDQFENNYYDFLAGKKDLTVLDIGANVGLFALHIAPIAKRLICIEPTPSHFSKLEKLTSHLPQVERWNFALAGSTGPQTFYQCEINTTMNSLQWRGDREIQVKGMTLPDLLGHSDVHIDLCKIDIEGSEEFAITVDLVRQVYDRIDKIFIELHPPEETSQTKYAGIFALAGYKVKKYFHDSLLATKD